MRTDGIDPERFAELMRRWLATDAEANAVHDLETGRITAAEFERLLAAELIERGRRGAGGRPAARRHADPDVRRHAGRRPA